jgi:hypothetical protein
LDLQFGAHFFAAAELCGVHGVDASPAIETSALEIQFGNRPTTIADE